MRFLKALGRGAFTLALLPSVSHAGALASGPDTPAPAPASPIAVTIPRLERAPVLDDLDGMSPSEHMERSMARVESFTTLQPVEGLSPSQRTTVYLGYDDANIYAVFLAFDANPEMIRARRVPREQTAGDDGVTLTIDTSGDRRRGYGFASNPHGIQTDFFETQEAGRDTTFDTIWHSHGRVTDGGYVVLMAIPFKSLRFPADSGQPWGILLERWVARAGEQSFWPRVTATIEGRLSQEGRLNGISGISQGRNMQFIPYVSLVSSRFLDTRDPSRPRFVSDAANVNAGLDAKFVLRNSLVLDLALNPDFSQVESDDPQARANARFELFVPERRPFFIENSDYFRTPLNLVFTRRVADPQIGVRLTGKVGAYAVGVLFADDEAPGKRVADSSPLPGSRAGVGIVRIARDLWTQSKLGFLVTDREHNGSYNRVAAVDATLRLNTNWSAELQAVTSTGRNLDGTTVGGPGYRAYLKGGSRDWFVDAGYRDFAENFTAGLGFIPRTGIRSAGHYAEYLFRTENRNLVFASPRYFVSGTWDRTGLPLNFVREAGIDFLFRRQTRIAVWYHRDTERVRPVDYSTLTSPAAMTTNHIYASVKTSALRQLTFESEMFAAGTAINFAPAAGRPPTLADRTFDGNFLLRYQPVDPLTIETRYILSRLRDREAHAGIFVNHIVRSRINLQFSRELSARAILQYDSLRANHELTSLRNRKAFNADFLIAYQINPWTALYAGYNGNFQNLNLLDTGTGPTLERTASGLLNDSRQFFVKFSYLIRM